MESLVICAADIHIHKKDMWRRIVIDSRHKTEDSLSDSDFSVEIPYPVEVPAGSLLYVEGVTLSHIWPTIQKDVNDKIYMEETLGPIVAPTSVLHATAVLSPGTYNSVQLVTELQTALNAVSTITVSGTYQYTVSVDDGRITIHHNIPQQVGRSYMYSQEWTEDPATYISTKYNPYIGQSANEVIGFMTNPNLNDQFIHSGQSLTLDFMDLQRHKQLYLCSPGLGESSMQLPTGDTSCIRRILCGTTMQGDVITDTLSTGLAAVTFTSLEILKRVRFILKGWDGKPVATGGHQLSFELVIQRPE